MGKDFGPWVRHDWCPRCYRLTEQTRWYRRLLGEPPEQHERRVRCNECSADLGRAEAS
ncbi:hypothetical protein [Nocardioides daeguensis]|uniref:Zinc-ribbon domain-containing protein n=1 Tax=Nocardioides daeguensis TaxID=908359 RepID=A0ABP6VVK5_9ACTN|nr:hypothetical protein [Nocardioides daeguensis]MBV6726886.1 hypothetical protein [Nocardioides daeguensis]MCR1774362.1 hypothetical protein [Nocardioides daeguensis]